MKNKILKATALFLAAICILSCVCGCGKKTVSTAAKGELTRLKWIEMLSDSFYIQNSKTEDPYFSDVSKENELFGKLPLLRLQICAGQQSHRQCRNKKQGKYSFFHKNQPDFLCNIESLVCFLKIILLSSKRPGNIFP